MAGGGGCELRGRSAAKLAEQIANAEGKQRIGCELKSESVDGFVGTQNLLSSNLLKRAAYVRKRGNSGGGGGEQRWERGRVACDIRLFDRAAAAVERR